jgi:VWFA-related protein
VTILHSARQNLAVRLALRLTMASWLLIPCSLSADLRAQQPQALPPQETQPPATPQSPQQAQPVQAPGKIAVEVKTVSVLATVHDKHGKIIPNLNREDFSLQEDGRPQTINYFARETDLPLRLGLLVDTSLSQRKVLEQERTASYSFLDHLLRPDKDLDFIIHFDREVELLQDFTSARPRLQAALQSLQTPQYGSNSGGRSNGGGSSNPNGGYGGGRGGGGVGRGSRGRGGAGTLLYDAIYLSADEMMSKQHGRKALIILSDGVDHGSKETLTSAIATAQRADTVIYSILFKDDDEHSNFVGFGGMGQHGGHRGGGYPQQEHPDGKKILEQISKDTGGRLFEVSKKDTLDKIYAEIEEELRNQYSIAYTPDKNTGAGYHKIELAAKQKDLIVQSRDGYYSAD